MKNTTNGRILATSSDYYYNNNAETNFYVGLTPSKNGSGYNGSIEVYGIKCRTTCAPAI